jgi:hypothetical protein
MAPRQNFGNRRVFVRTLFFRVGLLHSSDFGFCFASLGGLLPSQSLINFQFREGRIEKMNPFFVNTP